MHKWVYMHYNNFPCRRKCCHRNKYENKQKIWKKTKKSSSIPPKNPNSSPKEKLTPMQLSTLSFFSYYILETKKLQPTLEKKNSIQTFSYPKSTSHYPNVKQKYHHEPKFQLQLQVYTHNNRIPVNFSMSVTVSLLLNFKRMAMWWIATCQQHDTNSSFHHKPNNAKINK